MKHLRKYLLPVLFILLPTLTLRAQLILGEAFLKGNFVEVGVAMNGAFGTAGPSPDGYHPRADPNLGFVADPDRDGFTVGTPAYFGDYFLPGTPQEGWDIHYDTIWAQAWRGLGTASMTGGLTGQVMAVNTYADREECIWEGTLGVIGIRQITTVKKNSLYFTTRVIITNTSTATIKDIYYDRTVDADNEQTLPGGDFETINVIEEKIPNIDNRTLVTSVGKLHSAYLGLATMDCKAMPYIELRDLYPTDSLFKLYTGDPAKAPNAIFKKDSVHRADRAIGIVFKIDSLEAGESTMISYAYVLSAKDVDSAFDDLKSTLSITGSHAFVNDSVLKACKGKELDINIVGGEIYKWEWSPNLYLNTNIGSNVKVTVPRDSLTYTVVATKLRCPINPIKLTILPEDVPLPPAVVSPISYCLDGFSVPLTGVGVGSNKLRFYTDSVDGVPNDELIPPTNKIGTIRYYVTQVYDGLCESAPSYIDVIINPRPKVDNFKITQMTACGENDGIIIFKTDSTGYTYDLLYDFNGTEQRLRITSNDTGGYELSNLRPGTYSNFKVVNALGCISVPFIGPIVIDDLAPDGPRVFNNGPICSGRLVELDAVSVLGATYSWSGPDSFVSTDQNPRFTSSPKSGGVYTLIVTVGKCSYKPSRTILEIAPDPEAQKLTSPLMICEQKDLRIHLIKESDVRYQWTGAGLNILDDDFRINNIQRSQAGTYYLSSVTSYGCMREDSIEVIVDKRLDFAIKADTSICSIDSTILWVETDAPKVEWSPVVGLGATIGNRVSVNPPMSTLYTANAFSNSTCPDTSGSLMINIIESPTVEGYDTLVRMNIPYTITPTYGPTVREWLWTPSDSLTCSDCPNPEFNSNLNKRYVITVRDESGCAGSDTVSIRVFCDGANITMPNAFTPNDDGKNDIYYVRGSGFSVKQFAIYNRLGQEVFRKENFIPNDKNYGWDGTFNGQKISEPTGFVYLLEVICFNSHDQPEIIKGTVLLIR